MKPILAIGVCVLFAATLIGAQPSSPPKPYKVVFDLTTDDPKDQAAVLSYIRAIASVNPDTEMEVVMYGRGTSLVVTGRSTLADDVKYALSVGTCRSGCAKSRSAIRRSTRVNCCRT